MENIYIVTSGEYSDYCIEAVFKNLEKAEAYCRCHTDCDVNEFEFSDDKIFTTFDVIQISGKIDCEYPWLKINTYSHEDNPEKGKSRVLISFWGKDDINLNIYKVLPPNYDKVEEKNRAKRMFRECVAFIKNETMNCNNCKWYMNDTNWNYGASEERAEIEEQLESLLNEMCFSTEVKDGE